MKPALINFMTIVLAIVCGPAATLVTIRATNNQILGVSLGVVVMFGILFVGLYLLRQVHKAASKTADEAKAAPKTADQLDLERRRAEYQQTVYEAWDTVHYVLYAEISGLIREGKIAEALNKLAEADVLVTGACQAEQYAYCAKSTSLLLRAMQECAVLRTTVLQAQQAAMVAKA